MLAGRTAGVAWSTRRPCRLSRSITTLPWLGCGRRFSGPRSTSWVSDASCVEPYTAHTLRDRGFAFDGTVASMSPVQSDRTDVAGVSGYLMVSFQGMSGFGPVAEQASPWPCFGPTMSSAQQVSYGVGTGLLVSGEPTESGGPLPAPIGWGCGFTRYCDRATAASWRQSVGR